MSADFERIAELFEHARGLSGAEREAFLSDACTGDAELRREVEGLLVHDASEDGMSDDALANVRRRLSHVSLEAGEADGAHVPERIGPFTVVRRLGAGGMGVVYEALQDRPRRSVAIKVLRATLVVPSVQKRFEREAEILGRLRHPGIAQVYETGTCDLGAGAQPYFAMELVEGLELTAHAAANDLDARERIELVAGVCDAVHHAHTQGIVHRDLKPDNVIVGADGRPRILDFGVAHAVATGGAAQSLQTADGDFLGTLDYMAPEQVAGGDDARDPTVDVYALGAILFELLSGRTPRDLSGRSVVAAARVVADEPAAPLRRVAPEVPVDVAWIVDTALSPDLSRRYESALALGDELRRYLGGEPVRARPPSALYRFERLVRRNRLASAGVAAAFVSLVAGLVVSLILYAEARASAEESERQARKAAAINGYVLDRMLSSFSPLGMGRDVKVVDVLELAVPAIDEAFAGDPEVASAVRVTLGESYFQLGLWDEAEALLSRAHADLTRLFGADHVDTVGAAVALVRTLTSLERREEATALADEALEAASARRGANARHALELRFLRARLMFATGDREAALAAAREALDDAQRTLGLDETTLEIRYGLAVMEDSSGDLESAQRRVERYLDDVATLHDAGNPREVVALGQLALTLMGRGKTGEAIAKARHAVTRSREQFGTDHPTTIFTLATLASLLDESGALEEAREVNVEVIECSRRLLGDDNRATLRVRGNLAVLLRRMLKLDEALELAQDVLDRRIAVFGPNDPDVATAYDVLAAIRLERGEFDEADAAFEEALSIARAFYGETTPEVANILYNRATLRSRQGDLESAERMYRELYETELALFGPDHPYPLVDRYQVARTIARQGRDAEAIPVLEAVLAEQRRLLEPTNDDLLRTLATLGKCLVECDRKGEAVAVLREALTAMEELGDERFIEETGVREALARAADDHGSR